MNKKNLFKISTTDKSLILFIIILIFQQIYTIFFVTALSNIDGTLDVVFRTSLASIFGYILSSRFASSNPINKDNMNTEQTSNTIGFTTVDSNNTTKNKYTNILYDDIENNNQTIETIPTPKDDYTSDINTNNSDASYYQVVVATIIGLLSLITLIIYRNFTASDNAPVAAVSQLRDILSGSIGFLIGATNYK